MIKLMDLLKEGVYDKGILKAVFMAGGPGSGIFICLMEYDHDLKDIAPTGTNRTGLNYANYSGTTRDPQIVTATTVLPSYDEDVIGVASSNIGKVLGVDTATIGKVNGV